MRALVVDDDEESRNNLVTALSRYCESDSAANGRDAVLHFVRSHEQGRPYTFICLNQPLPVMDGLEALRLIRLYEGDHAGAPARSTVCIISALPDCRKIFTDRLGYDHHAFFPSKPVDLFGLLSIFKGSHLLRGGEPTRLGAATRREYPPVCSGIESHGTSA